MNSSFINVDLHHLASKKNDGQQVILECLKDRICNQYEFITFSTTAFNGGNYSASERDEVSFAQTCDKHDLDSRLRGNDLFYAVSESVRPAKAGIQPGFTRMS
ncbi:hypothetical protein [Desulfonatronum parangueonense]